MSSSPTHSLNQSFSNSAISKVCDEFYECDYEEDCTPLYKNLENAVITEDIDFDVISDFLDTGRWPHDGSTGPPPEIQARTWVTRFNGNNRVEWSQLPLHLAIVGAAPSYIIGGLVKLYPQALRCTDDQQMLPLHLALRHGADDETVAYLLMQFPEAVHALGKNNRTAIECALRARDKLRGIILETFVEKTKSKMMAYFQNEKAALKAQLESLADELVQAEEQLVQADEMSGQNKHLKDKFHEMACEFESLKSEKNSMEQELTGKIQELEKEKAEQLTESNRKVEKLTSKTLLESIELLKKVEDLQVAKGGVELESAKLREENAGLRQELDVFKKRIDQVNAENAKELKKLKAEISKSHAYRLENTRSQVIENIGSLEDELEKSMVANNSPRTSSELKSIKKSVSKLKSTETKAKSSDELNAIRSEIESLRTKLKDGQDGAKMKKEIATLKEAMEAELKVLGKTQEEVLEIKHAVAMADSTVGKTNAELVDIKSQLESLKLKLHEKQLAEKTKSDVDELKRNLESGMKTADYNSRSELAGIKKTVDHLYRDLAKTKSSEDMVAVNRDVEKLKEELAKKEVACQILAESSQVNAMVDGAVQKAEGKKQKQLLLEFKHRVQNLTQGVSSQLDTDELVEIKTKLGLLRKEFKEVEELAITQQELDNLKSTLEKELTSATVKTEKELREMKKAVDAINLEQKKSKDLKATLAEEIRNANGKTELELREMKKALDAIDLTIITNKNTSEWTAMRKEMALLQMDLKRKQETKLLNTEKQLEEVKKTIEKISEEQESKNKVQFHELRNEMEALKSELKKKEEEEALMQKDIEALQTQMPKKTGLKKFFRFSRGGTSSSNSTSQRLMGEVKTSEAVDVMSPLTTATNVSMIRPPSFRAMLIKNKGKSDDSDDDSSENSATAPPVVQKARSMQQEQEESSSPTKEKETTYALHRVLSSQKKAEKKEATVDAATVNALPSFNKTSSAKKLLPSALRKVKSVGPGVKNVMMTDPYEMKHTVSKTRVMDSGEVEVETVDEERSPTATSRAW